MFFHKHPYKPYILNNSTKLIVGTLPPPRFSTGNLNEKDVNFCYGSSHGQLWKILNQIFDLNLVFETTEKAIQQRKNFLIKYKIGVCDIVASCEREKIDATDLGMQNVKLRDIITYLKKYPKIDTLLFMGGNSKNGPEYFFRKHLKHYKIDYKVESSEVPRIHSFVLNNRIIKTISLTAPSGAANRAVGSIPLYKKLKAADKSFTTLDFRAMQYKPFFIK